MQFNSCVAKYPYVVFQFLENLWIRFKGDDPGKGKSFLKVDDAEADIGAAVDDQRMLALAIEFVHFVQEDFLNGMQVPEMVTDPDLFSKEDGVCICSLWVIFQPAYFTKRNLQFMAHGQSRLVNIQERLYGFFESQWKGRFGCGYF